MADEPLADLVVAQLTRRGVHNATGAAVARLCGLFKDRCTTTVDLAEWLHMYFTDVTPAADDLQAHVNDQVRPALRNLCDKLAIAAWDKVSIAAAIKETLVAHGLKMPQLAPAIRVLVCGRAQTPSIDAVLALFTREAVLARLRSAE